MCGIAGILQKQAQPAVAAETLVRMRDVMTHRGPDDAGVYVDAEIGLCHRRLSIIGLSTGHQPMADASERYWIVFNGEIYNYRDVRKTLEQAGYAFRTESDTEVIINAYAAYGKDCVQHLNGMFAFAIWDRQTRSLFLARDRLGVKPLYYADTPTGFVFGSEIKTLFESGHLRSGLNERSVFEYFLFRGVTGTATLFADVQSLLPAHWMLLSDGRVEIQPYWSHHQGSYPVPCSLDESVEQLHEVLRDAVKIRLMSEVPLGTFCSGGVDSSLVTALAAGELGAGVNTFSVGFSDSVYDETAYARMVAARYKTRHHELVVENADFADSLEQLIWLNDEPLHFANSVQIYAISKLAKEFVTVVLTGEGADELFLGYPRYQIPRLMSRLRGLSFVLAPLLRAGHALTGDHRLHKLAYFLRGDTDEAILSNIAVNEREAVAALLDPRMSHAMPYRSEVLRQYRGLDDIGARLSLQDQHTYLVSILNRQDKMSMGASIEARVPFLDYRVAEFANARPSRCRTRGMQGKEVVKQLARRYLPDEVVYRRKSGFGVPLADWLRADTGLGPLAARVFEQGNADGVFQPGQLMNLFKAHRDGRANHAELLWTALNFLIWRERYSV